MTPDTTDSDQDDQPDRARSAPSRRSFLRTAALVPVGLSTAAVAPGGETDTDSHLPVVDAGLLPNRFEPCEGDTLPFARRLQRADGRFGTDRIRGRAFTDRPHSTESRYSVGTVAVDLPTAAVVLPVRTVAVEFFVDVMGAYTGAVSKGWAVGAESDLPRRQYTMRGTVEGDPETLASIEWISASSPRFSEQWALAATDQQAVLTVVYGYEQGPWDPHTLFERISGHVRPELAGQQTDSDITRHYDHTPPNHDPSSHE